MHTYIGVNVKNIKKKIVKNWCFEEKETTIIVKTILKYMLKIK